MTDTSVTLTTVNVSSEQLQHRDQDPSTAERAEVNEDEMVDYSNNKLVVAIGVLSWLIIVATNVYAIVELGLGGQT